MTTNEMYASPGPPESEVEAEAAELYSQSKIGYSFEFT